MYYVPNVGAGLRVGNHNPDVPYVTIHQPDCRFLPDTTEDFDAYVKAEGETNVRRWFRVQKIAGCGFCEPQVLIEGKPPHERHAEALAQDDTLCGCGHKYVTHALGGGACYGEDVSMDDPFSQTLRRCECTKFVAVEPVTVTSEPLTERVMETDDGPTILLRGSIAPGDVPVTLPNGKRITGTVDAEGRLTLTIPPGFLSIADGVVSIGLTP